MSCFSALFVMLFAWNISYIGSSYPEYITNLPFFVGCISLLLRLVITIGYRIYFYCFPLKAMR